MAGKTEASPKRVDRPVMDSVAIESTFTVDREKVRIAKFGSSN